MRKGVADGVIRIPPHEFEVPSEWYYTEQIVINGEIGEITYGMTSIQNFIHFNPAVLKL
jgi:hypothetical protein